jgi:hypothetical protein
VRIRRPFPQEPADHKPIGDVGDAQSRVRAEAGARPKPKYVQRLERHANKERPMAPRLKKSGR